MSAAAKYNLALVGAAPPVAPVGSGAGNGAVTTDPTSGRFNIDGPMVWLLGIGAATLGLIAVSTSIRVGPFKASASI